jgi:ABC-type branched-subunit amino acid transport system permease subunit
MKRSHLLAALVLLGLLIAVPPLLKGYGIYLIARCLVFVIAIMGLNLTIGYAGQKSLGHAAFFGIGAYTVAILLKAGLSFWLGLWPCSGVSRSAWCWAFRRCACRPSTWPLPRSASIPRSGW